MCVQREGGRMGGGLMERERGGGPGGRRGGPSHFNIYIFNYN